MKQPRPRYQLEFLYTSFPNRHRAEWFKWEFLRRNSEYRDDYKKFVDAHGAWLRAKGYWYDLSMRPNWTVSNEKYFYRNIAPEIVRLCVKWSVGDLHPPGWRFSKERQQGMFRLERPSGSATGFPPELNWDHALQLELLGMGFTGTGGNARRYGHLVLVEFDLQWPMKDLVDFARRVLVRAQENYKDRLQEQGYDFPAGRRRFEDYRTHLKVWDLKHRKSKQEREIAGIVFGKYPPDFGRRLVRDHLKAAERLISGGYKEIR
jgi:hypothetical protein